MARWSLKQPFRRSLRPGKDSEATQEATTEEGSSLKPMALAKQDAKRASRPGKEAR